MSKKSYPKIKVLYEDTHIVAIDKPAGIMVHSDGRAEGPFLTDWIIATYPKAIKVGEPARSSNGKDIARPGIVHRLDRETSGVMLVAKTSVGHAHLKKQFQEHTIVKKYLAFCWGELKEEFGTIDRPIGRSSSDFRKWSAERGVRGELKHAETYWTRIWTGTSPDGQLFAFLEAEPKTGRTHQIRVHFKAINHPIVGDVLYAPKMLLALGFERTALHSFLVDFENTKGDRVTVESPMPKDFGKACKELGIVIRYDLLWRSRLYHQPISKKD